MAQIEVVRPTAILEFGSGTSSLALAWIMRRIHGSSPQPHIFSIDQSSAFIERTRQQLARHGLADDVRFLHADLTSQSISSMNTCCYDLPPAILKNFFGTARPSLVVIDGPAGENGVRFGTIPLVRDHLASNALIFLDDGLRDSELDTADQWNQLQYVRWDGVLWEGKGLLCGTFCPPTSPAVREWLEQACLITSDKRALPARLPMEKSAPSNSRQISSLQSEHHAIETPAMRPASSAPVKQRPSKQCLFLNTYYPGFLEYHYKKHPGLVHAPYEEQQQSLLQACFGDSDFYSQGLRKAGWNAVDVIANCTPLLDQWAKEEGANPSGAPVDIVLEYIRKTRPQVLYLQDLAIGTLEFFSAARSHVDLIVGQIASPVPPQAHLDGFDILISSFPHFVDMFRRQGRTAYYQPLAFDPRILTRIGTVPREFSLTFVGGLSPAHRERQDLLTKLGTSLPLHCWGYGTTALAQSGVDAARLHGDVWGLDMFSILARSSVTLNHHIDVAKSNANNMRLFEATGCGALLLTDYKDNLADLFAIGSEVATYRSVGECADLITYYLAHPNEAATIAKKGQARTLRDHTYAARMEQTAEILTRHLETKIGNNRLPDPDLARVSYAQQPIGPDQVTSELARSWRSEDIPSRQRSLVQRELGEMYRGHSPRVFQVLADALKPYVRPGIGILEVGCASGYYYEALEYLLNMRLSYVGVDFSDAMIRMARSYYPCARFEVGDGAVLRFDDNSFPIVISSGVLLHVQDYAAHITEAARVTSDIVVLHRTPMYRTAPTAHFKKLAYGVETFELRFNEGELFDLCAQAGIECLARFEFDRQDGRDAFDVTYVLRKAPYVA
jgi:ubiquinone/menaquinone biosynthesis C-methylase UbiE